MNDETDLVPVERLPQTTNATAQIEQSRAVQEVQAALIIAKRFPRDINKVYTNVIESCKRPMLAEKALYQYPRGGQVVTGPSIRLAEVLAQNYENLDFGVKELERQHGYSKAIAYCFDKERNVKKSLEFDVPHEIEIGKKGNKTKKRLSDPRDIYELVANHGARRLRACILAVIPGDLVDEAVAQCRKTIAKGSGEPISDRIRKMVAAFKELGVDQDMIAKRLEHGVELITADELVDLQSIYTALRDKQSKRSDFFDFKEDESDATSVSEKIKQLT